MRLIVLAGLVSVEKIQLAIQLANHFDEAVKSVTIIDSIAQMRIDPVHLRGQTVIRQNRLTDLNALLRTIDGEIVVWAVSETTSPEMLSALLDEVEHAEIFTLALIDTRTCDCFPSLRLALEEQADLIVNVPYELSEVLWALSNSLS